jgi:monoamine oxidase
MRFLNPAHLLIVGAGAAGLMAGRELARAGRGVTILEARDRCGGRIYPLPVAEFGYAAEGGAEFVHGASPVTRALMCEAGLSVAARSGTRWSARTGTLAPDSDSYSLSHARRFYQTLSKLKADLPIAEFLETHFGGRQYDELRRSITRTVEGYDAADPRRASTIALRDEWLARDDGPHGRIVQGYGALVEHLASDCRRHGAAIHLDAAVMAIAEDHGRIAARCRDGTIFEADGVILTVPPPVFCEIALPAAAGERAAAAADIGFGNVVKILLRFSTEWWADHGGRDLADLSFVFGNAAVPTWWTQYPTGHPVLTGWFAGPKAERVHSLSASELVKMGLASLAKIFGSSVDRITTDLIASRAINWGNDPFARGAYSYATTKTRKAQEILRKPYGGAVFFSGEALYTGAEMGTVEAALASGRDTAQTVLAAGS